MKKILILIILLFIFTLFNFCAGSDEQEEESMLDYHLNKKISSECMEAVNNYEGEIIEDLIGSLVVIGNEPFTRLSFKTEATSNSPSETYTIIKDCSKELWDLQGIKLVISGKVKETYLETVNKKRMKILTLYPITVKKKTD